MSILDNACEGRADNHKCRSLPLCALHLHVIGSILGYRCRCGGRRFHELKQKDLSLAYLCSKSLNIRVKGVLYFE